MAGDARHGHRRVDGGLATEVQAQLGILALPSEQRSMDCLGRWSWCVCVDCSAIRTGSAKYARRCEEQNQVSELIRG